MPDTTSSAVDGPPGIVDRVVALVDALRRAGVTVAISEDLDAVRALRHIDLADRGQFREALAAFLVKQHQQRRVFDDLFDLFFPARPGVGPAGDTTAVADDGPGEDTYLDRLVERLMGGDDAEIRRMAREAVDLFARDEGRDGTTRWFQYRVFRAVDMDGLLDRLLRVHGEQPGDPGELERRLARDEFEARLRHYRQEIEAEIRRRYAEQQGPDRIAERLVRQPLEERSFFRLSRDEQAELRRQVRPLARRLATRLAVKRRRGRQGRLDVRHTVRRSLATGGVPFEPVFRPRRPHKPELFVLCDVSGSVAAFARFTLMLVHTLQDQFSKVRSFAFVDTLDEVTDLFADGDFGAAVERLTAEADVVWFDGHSDYGHSLEVFARQYAADVSPRTSVLILGDARNNYRQSAAWALEDLQHRARRVYWLNPEGAHQWNTGDSIASSYARYVDDMVEVRNLKQLARFVQRIA